VLLTSGAPSLRRFACAITVRLVACSLTLISGWAAADHSTAEPPSSRSPTRAGPSAEQLSDQASNPNAPLTQLQLRDVIAPRLPGFDGTGNLFQMQAVVPVKAHDLLPFPVTMKLTIPITILPEPVNQTRLSPIQFFAQGVFKESWGSWGLGLTLTAPTSTFSGVPKGTWQLGPAAAIIYTGIDNLVLGGVFQQPISLYSRSGATTTDQLVFNPSITYSFPGGWFAGYSDFAWTVDWRHNNNVTFPVGLQVGKIVHIDQQPFAPSAEAGYNVIRPTDGAGAPRWMIGIQVTALFPQL
jgi:hypothetical protein